VEVKQTGFMEFLLFVLFLCVKLTGDSGRVHCASSLNWQIFLATNIFIIRPSS